MDIGINMPFKEHIKFLWKTWMADPNNIDLTNSSYRKSVPRETLIRWVDEAWKQITLEW